MHFDSISNLEIVGVSDKGNIALERVICVASRSCNLVKYLLIDATYNNDGTISDRNRHLYWFPDWSVQDGDYILLYTKRGRRRTFVDKDGDRIHVFYWGLDRSVWNREDDAVTMLYVPRISIKHV